MSSSLTAGRSASSATAADSSSAKLVIGSPPVWLVPLVPRPSRVTRPCVGGGGGQRPSREETIAQQYPAAAKGEYSGVAGRRRGFCRGVVSCRAHGTAQGRHSARGGRARGRVRGLREDRHQQ